MTAYIFQTLLNKAGKANIPRDFSTKSIKWFRDSAFNVTTVNAPRLMTDKDNVRSSITTKDIGKMFMYFYDPKYKDELPYYDKFPLIFLVDIDSDGFYGINLHYISPQLRAKLMDALFALRTNNKYDDTTRLKISYQILSSASKFSYFKPCFKRYLHGHVQGRFLNVPVENWDMALMLPTERFSGAQRSKVFRDSFLSV